MKLKIKIKRMKWNNRQFFFIRLTRWNSLHDLTLEVHLPAAFAEGMSTAEVREIWRRLIDGAHVAERDLRALSRRRRRPLLPLSLLWWGWGFWAATLLYRVFDWPVTLLEQDFWFWERYLKWNRSTFKHCVKGRTIVLICKIVKYRNLKYDHSLMYKKYTTPCPSMGCGVVERHLEIAQPTKQLL